MLTQSQLKQLISYDPETGIFTRLKALSRRSKIGDVVGSLSGRGYLYISINFKSYPSHRLAWLYMHGEFPPNHVDHINGLTQDNRIINLRLATRSQNKMNSRIYSSNTSGFKGVSFDSERNLWSASAKVNGKAKKIGRFKTPEQASDAYINFTKLHFGEFFRES
jgi:hypothetical protein